MHRDNTRSTLSLSIPRKTRPGPGSPRRRQLVEAILFAGRESSAATVMFHTAVAARAGLTATDSKTLDTLIRVGPVTAGELARHADRLIALPVHEVSPRSRLWISPAEIFA